MSPADAPAQIGVHLVFFPHIATAPDNTNVLSLAFGVLIATLIIDGSLWSMNHLNEKMMPRHHAMEIQR